MNECKSVSALAALACCVLAAAGCASTVAAPAGNTGIASTSGFAQYDAAAATGPATPACSHPGGMQGGNGYRR